jgi:hypothetical protein
MVKEGTAVPMDDRVIERLRRWENECRNGREFSAEELCADCPELVEQVRAGIEQLRTVNNLLDHCPVDSAERGIWVKGGTPLPGSRLTEDGPFGRGGSGEVWKAVTPGGFPHVLKRVRLGEPLSAEEERAMKLLPSLSNHPHLLEIRDVQYVRGDLVIAMEQADGSLLDRLRLRNGLGLPVEEVLVYLRDAAEGVDHLNWRSTHPGWRWPQGALCSASRLPQS